MAARSAMTIAHACGRTGHREFDCATETTSFVAFWTAHTAFFLCNGRTDHVGGALTTSEPGALFARIDNCCTKVLFQAATGHLF